MKKVFFYLLVALMFQQCTDELYEIDSVIPASDSANLLVSEYEINNKFIPRDSFSEAYYFLEDQQEKVVERIVDKINQSDFSESDDMDLSAHWVGDFEFEQGTYEFTVKSDKGIQVLIDNEVIFDNTNVQIRKNYFRIYKSLEGIRRLKVFYNMNSDQKLQKIIEYYASLNESTEQEENDVPTSNSANSNNTLDVSDSKIFVDWKSIGE